MLTGLDGAKAEILAIYLITTALGLISYQISKKVYIVLLAEGENGWIYAHWGGMLTGLCTMLDSRSLT